MIVDPQTVSVVIPTYNDARRLEDALSSIVGQSVPPGEIVVCDDGSDDGTDQLVRDFAARRAGDVSINYMRLPGRSGAATARNHGVAAARGAWIAVCDSDDMWAPTKLERQLAFLRDWSGSEPIAVLGAHGYNVNDAKKVISRAPVGPTSEEQCQAARQAGSKIVVLHSSIIYPRTEFDAVGGYSSEYGTLDDVDFACKMLDRGAVICLPERLVYYRKRAGSVQIAQFWDQREGVMRLTENQRRHARGEAPISREQFAARLAADPARKRFKRRMHLLGLYYYRAGATNVVNGHRLRGTFELALASILDGQRLRSGIRGAVRARRSREARVVPAAEAELP
jgi:glycosyltransferase involved in cell wall biosynthesis